MLSKANGKLIIILDDMKIENGQVLSVEQVLHLLQYFDDSSPVPLHEGLDFQKYSEKLSRYAKFILALDSEKLLGFIAYYLNEDGHFVYIPQIVVHHYGRHQGVGHKMLASLEDKYKGFYDTIKLEVLKDNDNARCFYSRESFVEIEDHGERLLLSKKL